MIRAKGDDTKDVAYKFACNSGYNQDAPYALSFVFKAIQNNNTALGGRATHFEAANSSSVLEVLITTTSTLTVIEAFMQSLY